MYIRHLTILLVFIILPLTETFSQDISKFKSTMNSKKKQYNYISWTNTELVKAEDIKIIITGPDKYLSRSYTARDIVITNNYSSGYFYRYKLPVSLSRNGWGGKGNYQIEIRENNLGSNYINVTVGPRFHWTLKVLPIVLVGAYFGYQFLMEPTSQRQSLPAPPEPN